MQAAFEQIMLGNSVKMPFAPVSTQGIRFGRKVFLGGLPVGISSGNFFYHFVTYVGKGGGFGRKMRGLVIVNQRRRQKFFCENGCFLTKITQKFAKMRWFPLIFGS